MKRIAQWTVLAIVLVATVLGAQSAPDKRDVVLDLGLPNGATPQLRITEGETGSIELPNVGKFGFVPSLRDGAEMVVVEVFDLSETPRQQLDRLEMVPGGDSMQTATKPPFSVRVSRVITK
jgi:hypothetical protein